MYLAIVGVAAAVAFIYEYYAFKQREQSSIINKAYISKSAVKSETSERNSLNGTDLRKRKHKFHISREVNVLSSNENSNLYVMEVAEHPARDYKILDDVIRNSSECNEKRYEKDVFSKVKNDLTNLNQNFEEKEISEKNIKDSSCVNCEYKATKILNSSVKYNPSVTIVEDLPENGAERNSVKHIEFDGDLLHNQFQKEKIKFTNQTQQIKLSNIDSSYVCSPYAGLEDHACYSKVQPSVTSPTVRLNEYLNCSDLQPSSSFSCSPSSVELKENIYDNSLQPSSPSAGDIETDIKVGDRRKLYYKYKRRISCDNTTYKEKKKICGDAFAQEYVSSKRVEKIYNSASYSQFAFNTVRKLETSKHINHIKYTDQNKNINLIDGKSNHVENILTSSINTVNQHPVLSSIEYPKNPIYLRTADHKFHVSDTVRGIGIVNYNQVGHQYKIPSDNASPSFVSHLHHKFMPGIQSYISSINNFVKKYKGIAIALETINPKSENNASLSIVNDIEITEAENVDIGVQVSSICESKSEELSNPSKLHRILCKGCMEVLANTVSVPCGHSYFCTQCAEITSKIYNKCCICRNHVTSFKHMTI